MKDRGERLLDVLHDAVVGRTEPVDDLAVTFLDPSPLARLPPDPSAGAIKSAPRRWIVSDPYDGLLLLLFLHYSGRYPEAHDWRAAMGDRSGSRSAI